MDEWVCPSLFLSTSQFDDKLDLPTFIRSWRVFYFPLRLPSPPHVLLCVFPRTGNLVTVVTFVCSQNMFMMVLCNHGLRIMMLKMFFFAYLREDKDNGEDRGLITNSIEGRNNHTNIITYFNMIALKEGTNPFTKTFSTTELDKVLNPWTSPGFTKPIILPFL